jgi:predicted DNA-binding transcriptional regulator AlpA
VRPRSSVAHVTTPTSSPSLLTARDVQAILRCSRAQAYGLLRYSIPVVKLGRSVRVRPEALDTWLAAREQPSGFAS